MTTKNAPHSSFKWEDRAIGPEDEDHLGYKPFAKMLASSVLRGTHEHGLVVGIYGAWGLGKSSLLNLIKDEVAHDKSSTVIEFNPWWFSGRNDLTERFFEEFAVAMPEALAKSVRELAQKFASPIATASKLFLTAMGRNHGLDDPAINVLGAGIDGLKEAAFAASQPNSVGVPQRKETLAKQLIAENRRIIVIIDDIDRLLPDEMLEVFRFVKAVGDLPNVTYVLAFDHEAATKALDTRYGERFGCAYLEKIVQVQFDLPPPTLVALNNIAASRLEPLFADAPDPLMERDRLDELLNRGIGPLLRTPRHVARLANAFAVTFSAVSGEVNSVDFLAMEALRLFVPYAYQTIRSNPDLFTRRTQHAGNAHAQWLNALGANQTAVRAIVDLLFPGAFKGDPEQHAGDGGRARISSADHFSKYFRYQLGDGDIERAEVDSVLASTKRRDIQKGLRRLHELARSQWGRVTAELHGRFASIETFDHADLWLEVLSDFAAEVLRASDYVAYFAIQEAQLRLVHLVPKQRRLTATKAAIRQGGLGAGTRLTWALGFEANRGSDALSREELKGLNNEAVQRLNEALDKDLVANIELPRILEFWSDVAPESAGKRLANLDGSDRMTLLKNLAGENFRVVGEVSLADSVLQLFDQAELRKRIIELKSEALDADSMRVLGAWLRALGEPGTR